MKVSQVTAQTYAQVVIDTNVLLSAALSPNGVAATLVDCVLEFGSLVFSNATFAELEARIWLPKFDRYLPMERRRRVLHEASAGAFWVEVRAETASRSYSRDTADDVFVHTAIEAKATRLITGDNDLLCLHPLGDLQILSPRAALEELGF